MKERSAFARSPLPHVLPPSPLPLPREKLNETTREATHIKLDGGDSLVDTHSDLLGDPERRKKGKKGRKRKEGRVEEGRSAFESPSILPCSHRVPFSSRCSIPRDLGDEQLYSLPCSPSPHQTSIQPAISLSLSPRMKRRKGEGEEDSLDGLNELGVETVTQLGDTSSNLVEPEEERDRRESIVSG